MGLYNILFGGSSKPRVTEKEFKRTKSELYAEGFSKRERSKIDEIFGADFNMLGTDNHPRGLERDEIDARIKWMRANKSKHGFSDSEISEVEAALKKRL
ncbi:MAG: hypothetical protein WC027_01765 [Candidatus Paceibacterota bacterium]